MKKRFAFWITMFMVIGLVFLCAVGCAKNTDTVTVKPGETTIKYTTDVRKGVELPAGYPNDIFPVYKDAWVMSAVALDKSYTLVCYSKDSVQDVGAFYEEVLKNSQIIAQTVEADEYTVMGTKGGYTYTVCVTKNMEQDKELKEFPTVLAINLVPAP